MSLGLMARGFGLAGSSARIWAALVFVADLVLYVLPNLSVLIPHPKFQKY